MAVSHGRLLNMPRKPTPSLTLQKNLGESRHEAVPGREVEAMGTTTQLSLPMAFHMSPAVRAACTSACFCSPASPTAHNTFFSHMLLTFYMQLQGLELLMRTSHLH